MTVQTKVGALIDQLYAQDRKIKALEKALREAKQASYPIEEKLLKLLRRQKLDGAVGKRARARIAITKHANIKNRSKYIAYIIKKKAYDLITNHIGSKAYFDRIDDGEYVPGVEVFEKTKVSITRVK